MVACTWVRAEIRREDTKADATKWNMVELSCGKRKIDLGGW